MLVARKPFQVYAWLERGFYRTGDTIKANFTAQTLDQKPVQGKGELTLYKTPKITPLVLRDSEDTPINLHVSDFQQAADTLEKEGYDVKRRGRSSGTLRDPWGNMVGLHDHRKM